MTLEEKVNSIHTHSIFKKYFFQHPVPWYVMGNRMYLTPGCRASRVNPYAITFLAHLALDLKVIPEIIPFHKIPELTEPVDEFCMGGPLWNMRTKVILNKYYPVLMLTLQQIQARGLIMPVFKFQVRKSQLEKTKSIPSW
jgi:hypothetical protein